MDLTGIATYATPEELFADPNVQIVDICTPTPQHAPLTASGVHALSLPVEGDVIRIPVPDTGVARSSSGLVAYIKATPDRLVATALGEAQATELWISNADGSDARRLVAGAAADSVERSLAGFSSPRFSPDGRHLYFLSRAWVTSDAVHAVDVVTGREWFVAAGNSLEVIPRGALAGCLLVTQHRYRLLEERLV